jgi:hypothetical protein
VLVFDTPPPRLYGAVPFTKVIKARVYLKKKFELEEFVYSLSQFN